MGGSESVRVHPKIHSLALLTIPREDLPLATSSSATSIFYVSLSSTLLKGYQIHVTEVEPNTAHLKSQITLSSENEVASADSIIHVGSYSPAPIIAWVDKSFKTLKINVLGKKDITSINIPKHGEDSIRSVSIHAPESGHALTHFLVHYRSPRANWAEVYHVDLRKGSVSKAYDLPKLDGKGAISVSTVDANVYFTRHSDSEVVLISSASHGILERWHARPKQTNSSTADRAVSAASEVVPKGSSSFAVRSASTLESGDIQLMLNGESVWTRPESLSGARCAVWVSSPHQRQLEKELEYEIHGNVVAAYVHRVSRHIQDLKDFPTWLLLLPSRILTGLGVGGMPNARKPDIDSFGFRKMIVVATEKGRVLALDSRLHGSVIWSTQAVELPPGATWNVTDITSDDNGVLKVTAPDFGRSIRMSSTGELLTLNDEAPAIEEGDKTIPIPPQLGDFELVMAPKGKPKAESTQVLRNTSTLITQKPNGSLAGWRVQGSEFGQAWAFDVPEAETISKVVARPLHDPVASIGRPLGDRNVLYKFLSPNVVLVATLNSKASSASVYLVDSISGQVLYSTSHGGIDTSKGVEATFSENWFAYTLHSDPVLAEEAQASSTPKSTILVVSELYESSIPNDRGPLGQSSNVSSLASASYSPYVVTATYIAPSPLSHLTTTSTKQGITPRSILAYSSSLAAILAIPVSLLSPRRPVGRDPTAAEREEGLMRYAPLLDLPPQWTLSHRREVLGIKGIVASPSDLESTSLVFAYGEIDAFGTRISPIGAFDMLGKGFGKLQLILTVVALAIGTGVLAPMVFLSPLRWVTRQANLDVGAEKADRRSLACELVRIA